MSLDKLKLFEPLKDSSDKSTEFVNVSAYQFLRITFFADIPCTFDVIFSFDGVQTGPTQSYKVNNNWSTQKCEVILDYCKIVVRKNVELDNNLLVCNVLGRKFADKPFDNQLDSKVIPSIPIAPAQVKEPEPEQENTRSKSPFRSILKSRKSIDRSHQNNKIECNDPRLPQYLPKNSVLIGSFANGISYVPPPTTDSYCFLVYRDNQFAWCDLDVNAVDSREISWKI